jgi:hypothetical protein
MLYRFIRRGDIFLAELDRPTTRRPTYQYQAAGWWIVQPDRQYLIDLAAASATRGTRRSGPAMRWWRVRPIITL